jgi:hypothetical protein
MRGLTALPVQCAPAAKRINRIRRKWKGAPRVSMAAFPTESPEVLVKRVPKTHLRTPGRLPRCARSRILRSGPCVHHSVRMVGYHAGNLGLIRLCTPTARTALGVSGARSWKGRSDIARGPRCWRLTRSGGYRQPLTHPSKFCVLERKHHMSKPCRRRSSGSAKHYTAADLLDWAHDVRALAPAARGRRATAPLD